MSLFLFGMAGAVAPELVRMWEARYEPLTRPRSFWLLSVAFAALGGLVAILFADSSKSAFVLGVSTPFVISGISRQAASIYTHLQGGGKQTGYELNKPADVDTSASSPGIDEGHPEIDHDGPAGAPDGDLRVELHTGFRPPSLSRRIAIYTTLL
jgi:hypothetical protein